jgi:hypothetical protein
MSFIIYILHQMSESWRIKWARHIARMASMRNAYTVLIGNPEGKSPLRRPGRRWEDNIKMHMEIVWEYVDWNHVTQDRCRRRAVINRAMKLRSPEEREIP